MAPARLAGEPAQQLQLLQARVQAGAERSHRSGLAASGTSLHPAAPGARMPGRLGAMGWGGVVRRR
jgi:hypothetical protein